MTETTNNGELFFDATCSFCTNGINTLRPWLAKRDVAPMPFENGSAESEMLLNWHDGRTFGGADAAIFLARQFWFSWPFAILAMLPGFHQLAHAGYRAIASRRHCSNGACEIDFTEKKRISQTPGWIMLGLFLVIAITIGFVFEIPAWLEMWMLSGALWSGFKIMAFRTAGGFEKISPLFFIWIGTDTKAFRKNTSPPPATAAKWALPVAFVIAGLISLLVVLPQITDPIATGWIGVLTMLSLFHFGSFAILAALFCRAGFAVEPIMQAPWAAKTLADFWGPRWNRAFSDWARVHVFRPLVRKLGTTQGTVAGFLASGIAHELVISLPARGGFGLPTLYFIIQAVVLLAQRKFAVLNNRFVTLAAVLIPAPILFHPVFIKRVFTPMIELLT